MRKGRALAACAVFVGFFVYCFCLFAWETRWGRKSLRGETRPWLWGTLWELQWAVATAGLVVGCAACAGVEDPAPAPRLPPLKTPRRLRVGGGASRLGALALFLVVCRVVSLHVVDAGESGTAGRADSSVWRWAGRSRAQRIDALKWHAFQLGWDAMVPMSLLGIPTAQFSPAFRSLGLSHEAAIGFHRVLGAATLLLIVGHLALYLLTWGLEGGADHVLDEVLAVCHHGPRLGPAFHRSCRKVSNFFGACALTAGVLLGAASAGRVRRSSYALFIRLHQLHFAWWFFACCHYPGMLVFVAPPCVESQPIQDTFNLSVPERILRGSLSLVVENSGSEYERSKNRGKRVRFDGGRDF